MESSGTRSNKKIPNIVKGPSWIYGPTFYPLNPPRKPSIHSDLGSLSTDPSPTSSVAEVIEEKGPSTTIPDTPTPFSSPIVSSQGIFTSSLTNLNNWFGQDRMVAASPVVLRAVAATVPEKRRAWHCVLRRSITSVEQAVVHVGKSLRTRKRVGIKTLRKVKVRRRRGRPPAPKLVEDTSGALKQVVWKQKDAPEEVKRCDGNEDEKDVVAGNQHDSVSWFSWDSDENGGKEDGDDEEAPVPAPFPLEVEEQTPSPHLLHETSYKVVPEKELLRGASLSPDFFLRQDEGVGATSSACSMQDSCDRVELGTQVDEEDDLVNASYVQEAVSEIPVAGAYGEELVQLAEHSPEMEGQQDEQSSPSPTPSSPQQSSIITPPFSTFETPDDLDTLIWAYSPYLLTPYSTLVSTYTDASTHRSSLCTNLIHASINLSTLHDIFRRAYSFSFTPHHALPSGLSLAYARRLLTLIKDEMRAVRFWDGKVEGQWQVGSVHWEFWREHEVAMRKIGWVDLEGLEEDLGRFEKLVEGVESSVECEEKTKGDVVLVAEAEEIERVEESMANVETMVMFRVSTSVGNVEDLEEITSSSLSVGTARVTTSSVGPLQDASSGFSPPNTSETLQDVPEVAVEESTDLLPAEHPSRSATPPIPLPIKRGQPMTCKTSIACSSRLPRLTKPSQLHIRTVPAAIDPKSNTMPAKRTSAPNVFDRLYTTPKKTLPESSNKVGAKSLNAVKTARGVGTKKPDVAASTSKTVSVDVPRTRTAGKKVERRSLAKRHAPTSPAMIVDPSTRKKNPVNKGNEKREDKENAAVSSHDLEDV
jgi:hypothetical protein